MPPDEARPGPPRLAWGDRADVEAAATAPIDVLSLHGGDDIAAGVRRRRAAAVRLPRLDCGHSDPLDCPAGRAVATVTYEPVTVSTLGLDCPHGPDCPAKGVAA